MKEPLLRVENLNMAYHPSNNGRIAVMDDISFQVKEGEFVCLVGPSGCGKTTLLKLVAGLEQPVSGRIRLAGRPVDSPSREVGFVFQDPTLMGWRTVEANVMLPLEMNGHREKAIKEKAKSLIDLVGLTGFETAYPAQLSGGMAQRVALARALIHDPKILLLDEPFGALDALTRKRMAQELLRIWQARSKTVLMVTHSVPEAVLLSDRVLVMGPRPTFIADEVPIDLPRPRTTEEQNLPACDVITQRIWTLLSQVER
jgi:NitT/TauT family transport system ATP-binding protein